jgi:predicted Fe-Mo cluster-binding NifX family protein
MKVCITAKIDSETAPVDPRFGRCAYFCFYDTESGEFSFEENTFTHAMGGVGVQTSQYMVTKGVSAVVTGQVGPNAYRALSAAEIPVYTGADGNTVAESVEKFGNGELEATGGPTNRGHVV